MDQVCPPFLFSRVCVCVCVCVCGGLDCVCVKGVAALGDAVSQSR